MAIKLNDALKQYAQAHCGAAADATDEAVQKALGEKLASGDLDPATYAKLAESKAIQVDDIIAKRVQEAIKAHQESLASQAAVEPAQPTKMFGGDGARLSPQALFSKAAVKAPDLSQIRVKEAVEQYDATNKRAIYPLKSRYDTPHPFAGRPIEHAGEPFYELSERSRAIAGAWFKMMIFKGAATCPLPAQLRPNEHDIQLINWSIENGKWTGFVAPEGSCEDTDSGDPRVVSRRRMNDDQKLRVKALLDDSVSGGIEVAPIEFDDAIITTPVLFGELYPFVNVMNITRGRRIKGGSMLNPTFQWGPPEGTTITPFNTQNFIAAFDTPIYNITSAILLGLDFLEDTPVAIGDVLIKKYGEKYLEQMDYVIANGDGVTQPLGIFNTAGPNSVTSDNGNGGPPTVSDYEGLYFAVQKQFRNQAGARPSFIGSDTSYQRARSIAVGPTDERRVFGMDQANYKLFDVPYRIQNSIPNTKLAFAMLNRYRCYRRLGQTVRVETGGMQLALANERLITVRGRVGGQMELGAAVALITNAQT